MDARRVNTNLVNILKKIEIDGISTHSLRYTFATRCAESGMSDIALKEIMGHYDIEVTKNVYIDIQEKFEQEEINKVEKYLRKQGIVGWLFSNLTKQNFRNKKMFSNQKLNRIEYLICMAFKRINCI